MIVQAPLHNRKERRAIANGRAFSDSRAYYQLTSIHSVEREVLDAFFEEEGNVWAWQRAHNNEEDPPVFDRMWERLETLFEFTH